MSDLSAYAQKHHLGNTKFYVDDGFTGTNFNRPGFQELLEDIEMGYVTTVTTKHHTFNTFPNALPNRC